MLGSGKFQSRKEIVFLEVKVRVGSKVGSISFFFTIKMIIREQMSK